ncbi:DNA-binding LacI/PurR family transcriptional regulator [Agromyces flavus]|uniref:DNA-binding LacI/PurR family transcriptional regulator n=1 Tax=Agromyces flavus TaxID=589382 RepID=A0A1H1SMP8_9MICO|nr:LacI family DNA-binding transcriptional regulator [Agromyces flavus]MCP2369051.1 DNA-binding LacI/PurR family transcriptional regulator [Agromyces flavus]SDS49255.1 DNA-binding transcriptional regulator, LacI/PurR family [Agromyces flavus]
MTAAASMTGAGSAGAPKRGRPTISDVAAHAGVSKGLVSFALNDRPGVSAETRDRILASAQELGWRPSVRARSLSVDRSFALGLVIGRNADVIAADPFFHAFIAGVESEFSMSGQVLVLAAATPGREEAETYRGLAADKRVDGVILTDLRAGDERVPLVVELGLAAVTLGRPDQDSPFPAVSVDDGAGIRTAVDHLAALGHRRIAHVAGPDTMLHGHRRTVAFESAMREAGLDDPIVVTTDFSASEGARATRALLERAVRPTAIVYSNDHMALAGISVARRAGIAVPEELSVTGFDNTDLADHVFPSLTSVATDAVAWGAVAARTLLSSIAGHAPGDVQLDAPRLVVRESTARPPT